MGSELGNSIFRLKKANFSFLLVGAGAGGVVPKRKGSGVTVFRGERDWGPKPPGPKGFSRRMSLDANLPEAKPVGRDCSGGECVWRRIIFGV